jgi:Holliday junction resolvase-like predicted endonuclease
LNSRAKGRRNERKAVVQLESEGWLVYHVKGTTRFNLNCDIFGLFDLVARKDGNTKWVQVKTKRKPDLAPFEEYKKKYCNGFDSVEIWVYKDYSRTGPKIIEVK